MRPRSKLAPATLAIQTLLVPESSAFAVCESSMREVEILHAPDGFGIRGLGLFSPEAFTEEHQLKPEPFAARVGHITRVIPPFRAKVLMLEMISGKLISIARQGLAILEGAAQKW